MQSQHAVDGAFALEERKSPALRSPLVSPRSGRRATARRASSRRATARQRKGDVEKRIVEYLNAHPRSTTGALAKRLNTDRATIAARVSHMAPARGIG